MLDLVGDDAKAKDGLKVCNAPRLSWLQLVVTDAQQKQIRQHRYAKGLLHAPFVLPHLMLTHPQVCFKFAVDLLNGELCLKVVYGGNGGVS